MAITAGNYTLKLVGGDYSTWASFWDDLGDLTGDITLTVDAVDFGSQSSPDPLNIDFNGYTIEVLPTEYPSTTDGTTGARFSFSGGFALRTGSWGTGTLKISGIVTSQTALNSHYYIANGGSLTFNFSRNIIKSGNLGIACDDFVTSINAFNNIIIGLNTGLYTQNQYCHFANNTIAKAFSESSILVILNLKASLCQNNLVYAVSSGANYSAIDNGTGYNNSSYDGTAAGFGIGSDNRINKTDSPFTNYANDDFTLLDGTVDPVGNGKDLSALFTDDFFGLHRYDWDIGAVAYSGSTSSSSSSSSMYPGWIYAVDNENHRVQVFTLEGVFVFTFGSWGTGPSQFRYPTDIAIDSNGDVYVCDSGNDRIQKFTSNGGWLLSWGSEGLADGQLNGATGIAIDQSDLIYVSDTYGHRIQVFTSTGVFVRTWCNPGTAGRDKYRINAPDGISTSKKYKTLYKP